MNKKRLNKKCFKDKNVTPLRSKGNKLYTFTSLRLNVHKVQILQSNNVIQIKREKKVFFHFYFYFSDFPTNVSIQIVIKNIHSLDEINMVSLLVETE